MNILFLTIGQIQSLKGKSVHIDVIKALKDRGHNVTVLATCEKRLGKETEFVTEDDVKIIRLKIGNLTKCSAIEKGINTVLLERQFISAIKRYFPNEKFDLVIYNTPPITLAGVVNYCKKKYDCKSYLMLKDIFPQNAVDLNMMSKSGVSGFMYKLFRKKEIDLYKASDRIGCMSRANIDYLLSHNQYIDKNNVEIFPNAVYKPKRVYGDKSILTTLGFDSDKLTFIYGGNLGKPQGLSFLADAIKACKNIENIQFIIVGNGSEKEKFYDSLKHVEYCKCLEYLPHEDYLKLCSSCDVGIIALDNRFTIPNYPSRILSYMESAMPIIATTDKATDVKELLEEDANCGKWCYSGSIDSFVKTINWFVNNKDNIARLGENGYNYLVDNFNTDICVKLLEDFVEENK